MLYGAMCRVFNQPLACSLEMLIVGVHMSHCEEESMTVGILMYLIPVRFWLQRLILFLNKLVFVAASILTAFKNKK